MGRKGGVAAGGASLCGHVPPLVAQRMPAFTATERREPIEIAAQKKQQD
jgi:hypothetical protein